jgi:hypothetical protein
VWLRRIPADVREVPVPGERLLAWGRDGRGQPTVVTTAALYLPDRAGYRRLPFDQVASATWSEETLEVVLVGPAHETFRVRLDEPGEVPPVVRERVTASIVLTEHVPLEGELGALITARRVSGRDGLRWSVVFDPGLDPADPALRRRADAAIAELRSSRGV